MLPHVLSALGANHAWLNANEVTNVSRRMGGMAEGANQVRSVETLLRCSARQG